VGKTTINHPPDITIFIGAINLPFPVMGGKNGIVLPTKKNGHLHIKHQAADMEKHGKPI